MVKTESGIILPNDYMIYVKPTELEISQRKLENYKKLAEIRQWGLRYPTRFLSEFVGVDLLDSQEYTFMMSWTRPFVLWLESRNAGKALSLDTRIPTTHGDKTIGTVKVGDFVYSIDGNPTMISYTSPVFIGNRCYEFEFEDGERIKCDADHLWLVDVDWHKMRTMRADDIYKDFNKHTYSVPIILSPERRKYILSIREIASVPTRCIQVDHPSKLYICGEKNTVTHNTTMLALFSILRGLLFNNYRIYICSGTADQSQETFRKIEDIALKNIESMTGLTDIFRNEVEISQANSNGFVHNPMGFTYKLYNGSFVKTLNSNINAKRGKRAEAVYFDEGGWLSEEEFNVIGAYTAQDANFKLGGDIDVTTLPKEFPHQLLYASSASSVDTSFYNKYRDFSKKMILGDPRYFVADINCDVVINTTFRGKMYPASLLNRETIDTEMRNNPEKALREYYNQFTQDGGVGQIIKRALIVRNSYTRPPVLCTPDNEKHMYVIAYDPARNTDNSVLGIGELKFNENDGYTMDIINLISFADIGLRRKTPMMTQNQIREIRNILLDYNGDYDDYDNIEIVLADAGSGGGGNSWVRDSLIESWKDKEGKIHPGLIDREYTNGDEYAKRYPDAINKLKLIEPSKYKSEMFEALIKMVEANKITFTEKYDNKGYLNILEVNEQLMTDSEKKIREELDKLDLDINEYEEQLEERLSEIESAKTTVYKLSLDEELALMQIDAMKEEIVNICRTKREGGKDVFKLPAHKDADTGASEATMHDDRAYVLAMLGWYLSEKRVEHIRNKKKQKSTKEEMLKMFRIKAPTRTKHY